MSNKTIIAGVLMDESTTISFVEVCEKCRITEDILFEMVEHGLVNQNQVTEASFDQTTIRRIQAARRLQQDLDINLPGVVVVLELLDQLDALRKELRILEHHVYPDK